MSQRTRIRDDDESETEEAEVIETAGQRQIPAPPVGAEVNNLPIQVAFAVPSTRGAETIDDEHFKERVTFARKWMSDRFGGDTTIRASGGYVTDEGDLIDEPVALVEASMSVDTYMDNREAFAEFVKERKRNWEQHQILYRVEDRVFIYPHKESVDDSERIPDDFVRVI